MSDSLPLEGHSRWDSLVAVAPLFTGYGLTTEFAELLVERVLLPARPVLVIGAGTGGTLGPLVRAFETVLGVDRATQMAEACRANGICCIVADARAVPEPDGAWPNVVVATGVLDCAVEIEARAILRETRRLCGPNGQGVFLHFDHRDRADFYDRWNLVEDNRVLVQRKIQVWKEIDPADRERQDEATQAMCRFFDAAVAAAREQAISEAELFACLPPWQMCRTPDELQTLLSIERWTPLDQLVHPPARAFAVTASPSSRRD